MIRSWDGKDPMPCEMSEGQKLRESRAMTFCMDKITDKGQTSSGGIFNISEAWGKEADKIQRATYN